MEAKNTMTPQDAYLSARFYLRCHAGNWHQAYDMACLNDDHDAVPMLSAAKLAYDQRHDRDTLRLGGSLKFRKARHAARAKATGNQS